MRRKTKFLNHKTFNTRAQAEKAIPFFQTQHPSRKFTVKERKFYGKLKTRFTVRSVGISENNQ